MSNPPKPKTASKTSPSKTSLTKTGPTKASPVKASIGKTSTGKTRVSKTKKPLPVTPDQATSDRATPDKGKVSKDKLSRSRVPESNTPARKTLVGKTLPCTAPVSKARRKGASKKQASANTPEAPPVYFVMTCHPETDPQPWRFIGLPQAFPAGSTPQSPPLRDFVASFNLSPEDYPGQRAVEVKSFGRMRPDALNLTQQSLQGLHKEVWGITGKGTLKKIKTGFAPILHPPT